MKVTALISALVFAHVAYAQASGSASTSVSGTATKTGNKSSAAGTATTSAPGSAASSSGNAGLYIPSTISARCSTFLKELNTNKGVMTCLSPMSKASSLDALCASKACSATAMQTELNNFKDECAEELTGATPDQTVIDTYDTLYIAVPFRDVICSKDLNTQDYCLKKVNTTTAIVQDASDNLTKSISVKRKRAQSVLVLNLDTYRKTYLPFLFTSPDLEKDKLCTSCTQQIMSKWFAFESVNPHALTLKKSPALGDQGTLWSTIGEKCGSTFVTETYNVANVQTASEVNGASSAFAGSILTAAAGALAAIMALI